MTLRAVWAFRIRREALRAWRRYLDCGDNVRCIDLGTVRPMTADERGTAEPAKRSNSIR